MHRYIMSKGLSAVAAFLIIPSDTTAWYISTKTIRRLYTPLLPLLNLLSPATCVRVTRQPSPALSWSSSPFMLKCTSCACNRSTYYFSKLPEDVAGGSGWVSEKYSEKICLCLERHSLCLGSHHNTNVKEKMTHLPR